MSDETNQRRVDRVMIAQCIVDPALRRAFIDLLDEAEARGAAAERVRIRGALAVCVPSGSEADRIVRIVLDAIEAAERRAGEKR